MRLTYNNTGAQLLLKYNLDKLNGTEEDFVYVERVLEAKKCTGKYRAIYEILKTFYVSPVLNYGKNGFYLEVVGEKVNVEMATYVGNFLNKEFDRLWEITRQEDPSIKGVKSKNSFFDGIVRGYLEKTESTINSNTQKKDLIKIQNRKENLLKKAYPRLGGRSWDRGETCSKSVEKGRSMGLGLNINRPLTDKSSQNGKTKFLGWF